MIGSATRTTTGKKILAILVAIAMVLTMSNISAYYASAMEKQAGEEVLTNEETDTTTGESADETPDKGEPAGSEDPDKSDENSEEGDQPEGNGDTGSGEAAGGNNGTEGNDTKGDDKGDTENKIEVSYKVIYNIEFIEDGATKLVSANADELTSVDGTSLVTTGKGFVGDETNVDAPKSVLYKGNKYDLDVVYNCVLEEVDKGNNNTVNFYYAEAGVDGVPAKYQATVFFKISDDYSDIAKIVGDTSSVVTFKDGNKPSYQPTANAVVNFPEVKITSPYHEEDGWYLNKKKVEGSKTTIPSSMINDDIVFEYKCVKKDATHEITADIAFYVDDEPSSTKATVSLGTAWLGEDLTVSNDEITKKINSAISTNGQKFTRNGYVLGSKEGLPEGGSYTLNAGDDSFTLPDEVKVYYYTDKIGVNDPNKGDRIADKYQIVVNFAAKNGTVGTEKQVVTLTDVNGAACENGIATLQMPATDPKPGYTDDTKTFDGDTADINAIGWDGNVASVNGKDVAALDKDSNGTVYTYTYIPAIYDYEVRCLDADNNVLQLLDGVTTGQARFGSTVAVQPLVKDVIEKDANTHYLLATAVDENSKITIAIPNGENNSFDAYYDIDAVGENADPFTPDGVADKNQARVDFKAVNGYFTGSTTQFVTLVNGVGILHGPLPVPYNNNGYEDPTWTPSQPTGTTQITGDTTFVITYKAEAAQLDPGKTDNPVDEGDDNAGNTDNEGAGAGIFVGPTTPDAADAADAATEPEADEGAAIPEDENPLVALPDDQKTIADDENALAGYEEGFQLTWLPFAIVAGIVCAGFLLFLVARRKKGKEDARTTY